MAEERTHTVNARTQAIRGGVGMSIPDSEWMGIIEKYQKPLFGQALNFTKSPQEAEDIVSETFMIVYEKRNQIVDPSKIGGFLRTTCYRECCVWWKKKQRFSLYSEEDRGIDTIPDQQASIEERLVHQDLMDAVDQLPEQFRDVIILRYLEGMSHKEIDQTLGISHKTSRSRLFRALRRLRTILSEGDDTS